MAVSYVGQTLLTRSARTKVELTPPAGAVANDVLVIHAYLEANKAINAPSGGTEFGSQAFFTSFRQASFWVVYDGSTKPVITWEGGASTNCIGSMIAVRGADLSSPIDAQTGFKSLGASTEFNAESLTASVAGDLDAIMVVNGSIAEPIKESAGFTRVINYSPGVLEKEGLSSGATGTQAVKLASSVAVVYQRYLIKPAGGTSVTIEPPAAVAKAVAAAPTIETSSSSSVTIEPPAAVAKAKAVAPAVSTTASVTIEPPAAVAKAVAPAPTVAAESSGEGPVRRIVVVREHVPSRLAVIIRASDGTLLGRWSQGAANIENVFFNLTKDGDIPGGHKEFSCTLARDPRRSYPDLATFARLELQGAGGETLWMGTIRQQPQDGERGTIEVKAVGDRQLLEDDETVIGPGFINADLSRWTGPSTTRRKNLLNINLPPQDPSVTPDAQGDAALHLSVDGSWVSPILPICEAWFDGAGIDIGAIYGDWVNGDTNTLFELFLRFSPDDVATEYEGPPEIYTTTSGHISWAPSVPRAFAALDWNYSSSPAGADGYQFAVDIINLKIVSWLAQNSLTLQGEWPNVGYTAKQMIPFIIEGSGLTTKDELLEDDGFVIPQAWFSDPTTRMSKLVEVTKYGLLDWFVFNDRILQYRFPGTYGRRWRLASGSATPKSSGSDGQRVWDRFMVTWQDVDGTTKKAGPPGSGADVEDSRLQSTDPRNAAVAQDTPRGKLVAINGKSAAEPAIETALRFKEEAEQLDQSGEVTISGHVQDAASGAWYPAAYVQPGDEVADPGTSNYRKITGVPYGDDSKAANCSIGAPPEGLAAVEERRNAKLLELGLG